MEQKTATYTASAPAIGLFKKLEQKKHQEKAAASAAKKRLIMQKNRSILRGESMLSQRDLSSAMVEPSVSTAASQVVSKLVAQFETSDSPIKQPGTHHTSTSTLQLAVLYVIFIYQLQPSRNLKQDQCMKRRGSEVTNSPHWKN